MKPHPRRIAVACLVLLMAALLFYVSYFQDNAEAYLFPGIVAGTILLLCLITFIRELFDLSTDDFQPFPFRRELFSLIIMAAAVTAAETIGVYTCSFLVLLLISIYYSPQPNGAKKYRNSVLFAAGFIGFIYLLFSVMLNVQLPKGLLI